MRKSLFKSLKNVKTTIAAVAGFIGILGANVKAMLDGDPSTVADWDALFIAIPILLGLIFAKDGDK